MRQADRSRITWLFARVVAFSLMFMLVSVIGGFVCARVLGHPVDVDKFYAFIGNAFSTILGAVLGFLAGDRKS
jgi:hypothetical protein